MVPHGLDDLIEMFHGKMDEETQKEILESFTPADSIPRCLVATIAFGMGLEVPNISYIIHWGAPGSLYDYWQEVGRCARDGKAQGHAILYSPAYSLSAQRCDNAIIEFVGNNNTDCLRKATLSALQVEGISDQDIDRCCGDEKCCKFCDNSLALH